MPEFLLSRKQFEALTYLQDEQTQEVFYGGAAGGGKSLLGCYWQIKQRLKYPGTRGVIGRSKLSVLKDSTLVTFFKVCQMMGLTNGVHFKYREHSNKIKWHNGSVTILLDLFFYPSDPDFHRFGSTEYTDAFIDEVSEVSEKAKQILSSRLRWMVQDYGLTPKMLMTGNPSDTWVKYTYIKDKQGQMIELPPERKRVLALVSDNPDKDFVRIYSSQLEGLNEYDKARLLHGDWDAIPRTGQEYFPPFSREVHVGPTKYNRDLPLHITFDFNAIPYMTLLVFQVVYQKELKRYMVYGLKEFCFENPRNTTKAVTTEFANVYRHHTAGIFYYGDYSGKNRSTMGNEDFAHNYDIIANVLKNFIHPQSDRVRRNDRVLKRRDFLIDILEGKLPIQIILDPMMEKTIFEMLYMKQGPDGLKFVQLIKDPKTLISYERFGHPSDATEYFLCSCFDGYFQTYERAA